MYQYNDGGRKEAGFKGKASDCVVRAIAIAMERPYQEVHYEMFGEMRSICPMKVACGELHPDKGVSKTFYRPYIEKHGWKWTPCMKIGSGCKHHLHPSELPKGRIIVRLSRHLAAVIDGVLHDTHDSSRQGNRCVYGYWSKA